MPISYRSISYTIKIALFHSFFNDDRERDVIRSLESYNSPYHPDLKLRVVKIVDFYKRGIEFFKTYIEQAQWIGNVDLIIVAPYYSSLIAAPIFGTFLKSLLQQGISLIFSVGAVEKDERFGVCGEIEKFFPVETGKLKYSKPENCEFEAVNPRHFIMHNVKYFNGGQISHRNKIKFKELWYNNNPLHGLGNNTAFSPLSTSASTSTSQAATPLSPTTFTPTLTSPPFFAAGPVFSAHFPPSPAKYVQSAVGPSTQQIGFTSSVVSAAAPGDEQIDSEKNELVAVWKDKKKTPLVVTKTIRGRNKQWGTICILNFRIWNNNVDIIGYQEDCDAPKILQNSAIWATTKGQYFIEKRRKIKEADKSFLKNLNEIWRNKQKFFDCELIFASKK